MGRYKKKTIVLVILIFFLLLITFVSSIPEKPQDNKNVDKAKLEFVKQVTINTGAYRTPWGRLVLDRLNIELGER